MNTSITRPPHHSARPLGRLAIAVGATLALVGCTLGGSDEESPDEDATTPEAAEEDADEDANDGAADGAANDVVRVVSHSSFSLFEGHPELLEAFEEETGYTVQIHEADAEVGAQLILTADSPLGDVAFGIDNAFAGRALEAGVFEPYTSPNLPAGAEGLVIAEELTPIDFGDVCLNVDLAWFEESELAVPTTFDDLVEPDYENLTVVTNAASSTPGLAMLLATVGHFGTDGWEGYWEDLTANGLLVADGWSQAYYEEFTAHGGDYPVVLSYASSPPYILDDDGEPTTAAMLETCFRQVEYAGVITGAENPEGAQAFIDFLLTIEAQEAIPETMFVFPVAEEAELPAEWAEHAEIAPAPHEVDYAEIEENRENWIDSWMEIVIG